MKTMTLLAVAAALAGTALLAAEARERNTTITGANGVAV